MTSSMEVNYYFLMLAKDRHCLVKILKEKKTRDQWVTSLT